MGGGISDRPSSYKSKEPSPYTARGVCYLHLHLLASQNHENGPHHFEGSGITAQALCQPDKHTHTRVSVHYFTDSSWGNMEGAYLGFNSSSGSGKVGFICLYLNNPDQELKYPTNPLRSAFCSILMLLLRTTGSNLLEGGTIST